MSYTVSRYPHGTFSWADIYSTDIKKTKAFLTQLFDWRATDMPTGPSTPDYTIFDLSGKAVAGGSPTYLPEQLSFWSSHVTVNDVEQMVRKAEKLGGQITMAAMDVLDQGKMATIQDPTGAYLSFWQPAKHIGAQLINTVGAMCWNELLTTDLETAKRFYGDLFEWTFTIDQHHYITIHNRGRSNGGMFQLTKEMGKLPSHWGVYFTVANLATAVHRVKELGGQLLMEKKIDVGQIAVVTEPTGAWFTLIEMSLPPTEWNE